MSNGLLAFQLGLEAGKFLSTASSAEKSIGGIISKAAKLSGISALITAGFGGFEGVKTIAQQVFDTFERGAALQNLHRRTGESVESLFLLQRGFQAVGIEGNELGAMLFHLQKGLTGVSDLGEETGTAFAMLGLNMQSIRALKAPEQIQSIAAALIKMDRASASAIAGKIFGREGAASFLQLARGSQDFTQALRDNAAAAAEMSRHAAGFQQIEKSIGQLKLKTKDAFIGLAEGMEPAIQKVVASLDKIDLTPLGKTFGDVIAGFAQTIEDHQLGKLLSLSLTAGVEEFGNFFNATLAGIEAAMARLMPQMNETAKGRNQELLGLLKIMNHDYTGLTDIAVGNAKVDDSFGRTGKGLGTAFGDAFKKSFADSTKDAQKALEEFIKSKAGKAYASVAGLNKDNTINPPDRNLTASKWGGFTSIEKMGFHFGAGGPTGLVQDSARQTALNTAKIAQGVQTLVQQGQINGCGTGIPPATFSQPTATP